MKIKTITENTERIFKCPKCGEQSKETIILTRNETDSELSEAELNKIASNSGELPPPKRGGGFIG